MRRAWRGKHSDATIIEHGPEPMEKDAMKRHCPTTARPTEPPAEPPRTKESASSACHKRHAMVGAMVAGCACACA
jgi:hypothetical protein